MDITHNYIEKGKGEPFILLHGNGEDCSYFKGQLGEFSKLYHVYAIDTRGHGKTLVIAGTNDMIKEEHTKKIARGIPDSTLVFIKGNHFIANKNPEEFNRAVLDFMRI